MKQIILPIVTGLCLACQPASSQEPPARNGRGIPATQLATASSAEPKLTRFDLNFPGGTPHELVTAIEKAWLKPLNAIIPDDLANMRLPALKMTAVTVPQLFDALQQATAKAMTYSAAIAPGGIVYGQQVQQVQTSYGFRTQGQVTDESIWHFFYDKPSPPQEPRVCRFYQLGPYLDTYKIEDITTAIETGWQMLGETLRPEIKFHKDTKLLIAVGESSKLAMIDSVLTQLGTSMVQKNPGLPAAKSGEKNKP